MKRLYYKIYWLYANLLILVSPISLAGIFPNDTGHGNEL